MAPPLALNFVLAWPDAGLAGLAGIRPLRAWLVNDGAADPRWVLEDAGSEGTVLSVGEATGAALWRTGPFRLDHGPADHWVVRTGFSFGGRPRAVAYPWGSTGSQWLRADGRLTEAPVGPESPLRTATLPTIVQGCPALLLALAAVGGWIDPPAPTYPAFPTYPALQPAFEGDWLDGRGSFAARRVGTPVSPPWYVVVGEGALCVRYAGAGRATLRDRPAAGPHPDDSAAWRLAAGFELGGELCGALYSVQAGRDFWLGSDGALIDAPAAEPAKGHPALFRIRYATAPPPSVPRPAPDVASSTPPSTWRLAYGGVSWPIRAPGAAQVPIDVWSVGGTSSVLTPRARPGWCLRHTPLGPYLVDWGPAETEPGPAARWTVHADPGNPSYAWIGHAALPGLGLRCDMAVAPLASPPASPFAAALASGDFVAMLGGGGGGGTAAPAPPPVALPARPGPVGPVPTSPEGPEPPPGLVAYHVFWADSPDFRGTELQAHRVSPSVFVLAARSNPRACLRLAPDAPGGSLLAWSQEWAGLQADLTLLARPDLLWTVAHADRTVSAGFPSWSGVRSRAATFHPLACTRGTVPHRLLWHGGLEPGAAEPRTDEASGALLARDPWAGLWLATLVEPPLWAVPDDAAPEPPEDDPPAESPAESQTGLPVVPSGGASSSSAPSPFWSLGGFSVAGGLAAPAAAASSLRATERIEAPAHAPVEAEVFVGAAAFEGPGTELADDGAGNLARTWRGAGSGFVWCYLEPHLASSTDGARGDLVAGVRFVGCEEAPWVALISVRAERVTERVAEIVLERTGACSFAATPSADLRPPHSRLLVLAELRGSTDSFLGARVSVRRTASALFARPPALRFVRALPLARALGQGAAVGGGAGAPPVFRVDFGSVRFPFGGAAAPAWSTSRVSIPLELDGLPQGPPGCGVRPARTVWVFSVRGAAGGAQDDVPLDWASADVTVVRDGLTRVWSESVNLLGATGGGAWWRLECPMNRDLDGRDLPMAEGGGGAYLVSNLYLVGASALVVDIAASFLELERTEAAVNEEAPGVWSRPSR